MRKKTVVIALLCALLMGRAAAVMTKPSSHQNTPVETEIALIHSALEQLKNSQPKVAGETLQRVIDAHAFVDLQPKQQHIALQLAGAVAVDARDYPRAVGLLKRSSAMLMADDQDWYQLLVAAYPVEDFQTATDCIIMLAQRWPKALNDVRSQVIFRLAREAKKFPPAMDSRFRLLSALETIHWASDSGLEPAFLWRDLVLMLADRGDDARAERVALSIDDAGVLLGMGVDRRFDRFVASNRSHFDVPASLDREIKSIQAKIMARPRQLNIKMELTYRLLRAGRFAEVLKLADEVQQQVASQDKDHPAYDDEDNYLLWILDSKARALRRLARWDEALAIMQEAALRPEQGQPNVSQAINLGDYEDELGKPAQALEAINALGDISAYGRMMIELVRHSAAIQTGDAGMQEASLDYLRAHRADARTAPFIALCQAGRQDEAAAELQLMLADVDQRIDALESIQQYRRPAQTPVMAALTAQIDALVARKDVREAIEKVGRIERFDIFEPIT